MHVHAGDPCERLLVEWQFRREVVNAYYRALRFLTPENGDAPSWQRERWREPSQKLAIALVALGQASDQLGRCEREHARAISGRGDRLR